MSTSACHYKRCSWISKTHASFEMFSFLSDLEGFNQFTTVLPERKAIGAQRVDCYVHNPFAIHKPVQCNSGRILYLHFLVGLPFSPRKNTLEKTVAEKLTPFERCQSYASIHSFTHGKVISVVSSLSYFPLKWWYFRRILHHNAENSVYFLTQYSFQ